MNILFVSSDKFPPFRPDIKTLFFCEFTKRGHKIDWILQAGKNTSKAFQTIFLKNIVYVGAADYGDNFLCRLKNQLLGFINDVTLFKILGKKKYNLIIVKDKYIVALLGLIAARFFNAHFCFWLSYPFPEAKIYQAKTNTAPRYRLLYLLRGLCYYFLQYKIILPWSEHVFVQSDQMKQDICGKGISALKITPVPMGVDMEEMERICSLDYGKQDSKIQGICYLGTMIKVRRLDFLIRVFYKVKQKVSNVRLYMIGGGGSAEDIERLRNEAKRLAIDDCIVFTGQLPRDQALSLVCQSVVCVSPFYPTFILNSTSPTKLIEYMALGKPVVANDHPEQSRIIKQSKGGICVPYNEDEFARALISILKDPKKAHHMGALGKQYVLKNRTYRKIAEKVEQSLLEIIHK